MSFYWFSYVIIYKLVDDQVIKARLNLYIAVASTVSLIQLPFIREYLITLGSIIVSYRWINYIIEERKLWKRNGT